MTSGNPTAPTSPHENHECAGNDGAAPAALFANAVVQTLRDLAGVVAELAPHQYTASIASMSGGTVGGHVRHCLDHIRALLDTAPGGIVDYDQRVRGTRIESDPQAARDEIRRLRHVAEAAADRPAASPLIVRVLLTPDRPAVEAPSTLGRELAFVLSHTVHHNAMIRSMALSLGVSLPSVFGVAPSTLAHRRDQAARPDDSNQPRVGVDCPCAH